MCFHLCIKSYEELLITNVHLYLCTLEIHFQLLFSLPRKQQETNFSTFHCFSQLCLLALTTFPHLLNPPVFLEEILWTQYQAFFSCLVFLGSVPTCGSWLNSPALCFDSLAPITIPALLFLPTPPVAFPSINHKTCQAGFYTRILSTVSFPVSWLNSPPCWRCEVNAASLGQEPKLQTNRGGKDKE